MYKSISQVPKDELQKLNESGRAWGIVLRDAETDDFEKVVCVDGKKPFTKENLILEIDKLVSFPDYVLLPSKLGDVHVVWFGRGPLTEGENKKMEEIFKDVFGIINYI